MSTILLQFPAVPCNFCILQVRLWWLGSSYLPRRMEGRQSGERSPGYQTYVSETTVEFFMVAFLLIDSIWIGTDPDKDP